MARTLPILGVCLLMCTGGKLWQCKINVVHLQAEVTKLCTHIMSFVILHTSQDLYIECLQRDVDTMVWCFLVLLLDLFLLYMYAFHKWMYTLLRWVAKYSYNIVVLGWGLGNRISLEEKLIGHLPLSSSAHLYPAEPRAGEESVQVNCSRFILDRIIGLVSNVT